MNSMNPNGNIIMTVENLCAILKACTESGVSELKFEGLEVSFWGPTQTLPQAFNLSPEVIAAQEQVSQDVSVEQEVRSREDELAEMLVNDPEKFEDLLASGDLIESSKAGDRVDEEADDQ